jgi:uncharacterized membrane protein
MKEKTRFMFSLLLGAVMLLGVVGAILYSGSTLESAGWMIIALIVTVLFVAFIIKDSKRLKAGLPREDEMSVRMKHKAGYYTLLIMIYFTIGFNMVQDIMVERGLIALSAYDALTLEVMVMLGLFVLFWFYFSRKGD